MTKDVIERGIVFKIDSLSHAVKDFLGVSDIHIGDDGRITLAVLRPKLCGICGRDCGFVRNGFYPRGAVTLIEIISFYIQRFLCKGKTDKRHTFSALPLFCFGTVLTLWIFIQPCCCLRLARN